MSYGFKYEVTVLWSYGDSETYLEWADSEDEARENLKESFTDSELKEMVAVEVRKV